MFSDGKFSCQEISNTEILRLHTQDVRFQLVAKEPTVTYNELTRNMRSENPTRQELMPADQEEHKLALGGCINKPEVKNKIPKKADGVAPRLSSPMFDANMIRNNLNTSKRLTGRVSGIEREKPVHSEYFLNVTFGKDNKILTAKNQDAPFTDDNICSNPLQERFPLEFTKGTMKSIRAGHKFPHDGCSFIEENSVVGNDKIATKNMGDGWHLKGLSMPGILY